MKQKGVRDPAVGVRHRETTRDERMRVISLRENARWSWRQIGRELRFDPRTASRIHHRYNQHSTPSNRKRTGRPLIFDDKEKARLVAFITRDSRTWHLSWEAICIESDPKTVRNVMISLGYHKRVPRTKFNVKPDVKILTSSHCLGSTGNIVPRRAYTVGLSFSFGSRAVFVQLTGTGKYFPLWFSEV